MFVTSHTFAKFLSLKNIYRVLDRTIPWVVLLLVFLLGIGLFLALYLAPSDYKQGEAYRIIFIHVPSAWMSLLVYLVMAFCGFITLVWRLKLASFIHTECAWIGAWFTAVTLVTGMLWGKPMWGAFWVWDARLTSELILLFLYLGVILLLQVIPERDRAIRASSLLALLGTINIPLIHYSVNWWNTLHQPASITKLSAPSLHISMLLLLLFMSIVFLLLFITVLAVRLRLAIAENCWKNEWWIQYHSMSINRGTR